MAYGKVTGASEKGLHEMRREHLESPLYNNHNIEFDTAYCLTPIGKQPEEYDGVQRYCKKRASKKTEEKDGYEGPDFDKAAYCGSCNFHGRNRDEQEEYLESKTARITHGAYAEDEHLKMDFDEHEQELYDSIMEEWPEIYSWPTEDEDPARYRILRRVAVNEVRSMREEDYIDNHEVHEEPIFDEQGVQVGTKEVENPLSREYRLLMSEITNQMKELGLTPREQQKMDTMSSQADKDDALSDIASEALDGDEDYNPDQFK